MSRKNKKDKGGISNIFSNLKEETVHAVLAVVFFVIGLLFIFASFGKAGIVGENIFKILSWLLGFGYYLLPILFFALSLTFFKSAQKNLALTQTIGSVLFVISGLGIIEISKPGEGGVLGHTISSPLIKLFDLYTTLIILIAVLIISILIIFDTALKPYFLAIWTKLFRKKDDGKKVNTGMNPEEEKKLKLEEKEAAIVAAEAKEKEIKKDSEHKAVVIPPKEKEVGDDFNMNLRILGDKPYSPPPLSLLERDSGRPGVGDIKANANIIKRTLMNFGIDVEMDEISIGPSVTRYALKPAEGVKLSRIVGLQNDLALALAAHPIRIEAPIPGKSLVGIEIPNSTKTTVGLGTLLASEEFSQSDKPLLVSLGKGISGRSYFGNLSKMPHLLIAGATGSGKSVTIHAIITTLLYRNSPENLKFMMIDPKRVELTLYNKIPHLLTPVITDAKKTILALKWAAKEMDRRYDILEAESVRDIDSYHKNILAPELKKYRKSREEGGEAKLPETMPYIIIVIDELADIMQAYPRELEGAIVRLAQMSRAVGIHLILSTQRPSVNVITGLIKANVPTRIALQVASQIDSRTILDMGGAEKLLGAGDMLYLGSEMSQPQRIQSAFISETEVKNVAKYLADGYKNELPNEINLTTQSDARDSLGTQAIFEGSIGNDDVGDDDLYEEAREIVIQAGKASTSYLQRKLRIGYARAARLIDLLEENGVVGAGSGAKAREVLGGNTNVSEEIPAHKTLEEIEPVSPEQEESSSEESETVE
ncbi:MAG: DNA translocase FtsK 4TM domain-containing protein [Parcubacteria group bacterium]|nr:DNA translocase FtsK 4TM domain-containing protein [Parcubacteria group bacterium]